MSFKNLSIFFIISLFAAKGYSQNNGLLAGPWAGNVELRTATIWMEVVPTAKDILVSYSEKGGQSKMVHYKNIEGRNFAPVKIDLVDLKMNTTYNYTVIIDGRTVNTNFKLSFKTKELWQWRKPAPDFTFLTGSCAYFNEPEFDRPGKPYGLDSSIFETMADKNAAFHLWLGDNWYTREPDFSVWGLQYRAHRDRSLPVLQRFMASMPQYSIWDDHDYGPNDEGKSYLMKDESRKLFMDYSCNPTYGENGKGIYTKMSYSDVDFFLTDDRYFRSEDNILDSVNGAPNPEKTFFGRQQMEWLKNALVYSKAVFKVVAVGSQVLNPYAFAPIESMNNYSAEKNELLKFIADQHITGIIFLTGDRHHSEVIKIPRKGTYPLYDVTVSPYTSGISGLWGNEKTSEVRVSNTLVLEQNFAEVKVSGEKGNRKMKFDFIGLKGNKLASWEVNENEIK